MKKCWLAGILSLLSGMSWAQCATGSPGTSCTGPLTVQPQTGNNSQSAITLVDLGLPLLAPAVSQYTLSVASGMLVESDNGNSYHSLMGPQGPQGPAGPVGAQGATGATGATRAVGQVGSQGPSGAVGPAGAVGPVGPAGATGATGATGAVGPQGTTGATGLTRRSDRLAPPDADRSDRGTGTPGVAGAVGPAGLTGSTGTTGRLVRERTGSNRNDGRGRTGWSARS